MKKRIDLKLYKNNKIEQEYYNKTCIENDNNYTFIIDNVTTKISNTNFIRETSDYFFNLDIIKKSCLYILKTNNLEFDIEVKKVNYYQNENKIILDYEINTDEEPFKIEINIYEENVHE